MHNPLVSIIIPTFNRAQLIGETLNSVLAQSYENWECIIVDDGSTDNSWEVIGAYVKKDSRFQYHNRPADRPKGANACRNYGLGISKGQFVMFFDSDDILTVSILSASINLLTPKVDFIFYNYLVFYKEISNIIYHQNNDSTVPFLDYFSGKINLATPSILWKREVINGMIFDENLEKSQELNFVFKIYEKYTSNPLSGLYLDGNGFLVRKHENSIVSSFYRAQPTFLLSDIKVRNQILNYFDHLEFGTIHSYQRHLLEKSIRLYLFHSSLLNFGVFIMKISSIDKVLFILKLMFYKIIYKITKREHRLNKTINTLFKEGFYLKMN